MSRENVFWEPGLFFGGLDRHNQEYTPREVVTLLQKAQFSHYNLAYINTPSHWNAKTAEMVYALLSKWQTLPELLTKQFFTNTIFVKATR